MKIYVVVKGYEYEGNDIPAGVFSSITKAIAKMDEMEDGDIQILEYTVNASTPPVVVYPVYEPLTKEDRERCIKLVADYIAATRKITEDFLKK